MFQEFKSKHQNKLHVTSVTTTVSGKQVFVIKVWFNGV